MNLHKLCLEFRFRSIYLLAIVRQIVDFWYWTLDFNSETFLWHLRSIGLDPLRQCSLLDILSECKCCRSLRSVLAVSPVYSRRQAGPDAVCSLVMSCHEPAFQGQASIMISPALALSPDFTIAMVLASPLLLLTSAWFYTFLTWFFIYYT